MSFKNLNLNSSYNSARNNLVDEFYIPVLTESIKYDRITGFFNSSSLALAARGLKNFIINGGKMRLLCGTQLSPEDLNSIINASDISKKISENFLEDITNINNEIKLNHIKEDAVTKYIEEHLPNDVFSARDIVLAKRLWTRFQELAGVEIERPELWAGAVLWNLGGINALFSINDKVIVNMLEEVQPEDAQDIFDYGNKIFDVLQLGDFDVRFLNEEGLLKKFFTEILV